MAKYLLYGSEENGLLLEAEPSIIHLETGEGITPVSVQNAYTLTCDTGTYNVTGYDATITKSSVLQCDTGTYLVTGNDVGLEVSLAPEPETIIRGGEQTNKWQADYLKRLLQEDEEVLSIIYTFIKCQD